MSDVDGQSSDRESANAADSHSDHGNAEEVDEALFTAIRPAKTISAKSDLPTRIRRYRIKKLLGSGSFGRVFLAYDDQLQRDVAIKVPANEVLNQPGKAHRYLEEARVIANLEHPHIVPVYDVGSSYDFPCFIVTKYVAGTNLAKAVQENRPSPVESIRLVIMMARALHYSHGMGIVHRDVKPENILIDRNGTPFLVDLGLALTNENAGRGPRTLGTPAYMSPEQARGEGHRVDGRSDIYSLGVVLFELLVGRRPFLGDSSCSVMERSLEMEPPSLRQIDESIPIELERICSRCLAKWAADRYSTAADLADDLDEFLEETQGGEIAAKSTFGDAGSRIGGSTRIPRSSRDSRTSSTWVPKGLRNYDRHDADCFLAFLPGPVDRHGIPDSIAFWKRQIDPMTGPVSQPPFDIGVIYGPSGCGKSSFIQAGLIPRLSNRISVVFIQASAEATEQTLLEQLRRHFPQVPDDLDLVSTLQKLRTDEDLRLASKVLIVIDQFEQWLSQQNSASYDSDLAQALRHCDGDTVQTILLIRDEFWVSITEFLRALDVTMSERRNLQCVSAFDASHARKVLHLLGAAYQRLPQDPASLSQAQRGFLEAAVDEVSEDGRTTCIQLALIAEILKDQEWVPATLHKIGGIQGIGVRYFEQQFDDDASPPHHRRHRKQIEAMLLAMLPPTGVSMRGRQMSAAALSEECGVPVDSSDFRMLLQILDQDTRIITPVDALAQMDDSPVVQHSTGTVELKCSSQSYQLTHDYLVPSVRQWLRSKQSETRTGRTQMLLRERSVAWNSHPENRRLPSFFELLNIVCFVGRKERNSADIRMLRRAIRYYTVRLGSVAVVTVAALVVSVLILIESNRRNRVSRAESMVNVLTTSPIEAVPLAISNLHKLDAEAYAILKRKFVSAVDSQSKLRLGLALADFGDMRTEFLVEQIPDANSAGVELLVHTLSQSSTETSVAILNRATAAQDEDDRARFLLAAMDLGALEAMAGFVAADTDPTERSYWICHFDDWSHRWDTIGHYLESVEDSDTRSALILGLSRVDEKDIAGESRRRILERITVDYVEHPCPLVHSSCLKLLSAWGEPVPTVMAKTRPEPLERWYHTPNGLTMVRVQDVPERFEVGFSVARPKSATLWMSDTEVTFRLYQRFMDDSDAPERKLLRRKIDLVNRLTGRSFFDRKDDAGYMSVVIASLDQPVEEVHVEDAILYCNWLSRREGFRPAYTRLPEKLFGEDFSRPNSDPNSPYNINNWELDRNASGYRLPIQLEWEIFRFGGSRQKYPFGRDPKWLEEFAVVSPAASGGLARQHAAPARSRLPNNYGVFDLTANALELGHYLYAPEHEHRVRLELTNKAYGIPWNASRDSEWPPTTHGRRTLTRDERSFRVVRNSASVSDD